MSGDTARPVCNEPFHPKASSAQRRAELSVDDFIVASCNGGMMLRTTLQLGIAGAAVVSAALLASLKFGSLLLGFVPLAQLDRAAVS